MARSKKTKTADKKALTLAKQTKKAAKGEKKAKVKDACRDDDSDAEDVDLDAVLAAYAEEQAKFLKVTEDACEPPSPRSSSTIIASPSNRNELFVFGGEYYDGSTARFFNDLFVFLIDRGEWRQVRSPNSPLPRSGHAWCRGAMRVASICLVANSLPQSKAHFITTMTFGILILDRESGVGSRARSRGLQLEAGTE